MHTSLGHAHINTGSLKPGTWNQALWADSRDSAASQKKEKKMLTDIGHSSTLQWEHIMVGQHQHRKCFPNLLKLGTFYLSNARRKLYTASEANTPSAWSFSCSAQMQWGTAAGTFVSGSGKGEGTATLQKGNNSQLVVFSRDPISKGVLWKLTSE